MKIGIPRALLYYQYYPMWQAFFEALGAEVVVSKPTTQDMLVDGSSRVVADTCLPVKVFMGHVTSLSKQCDYIFIPAIRSVEKDILNCSKFLGLPDMTNAVIPESAPILDIDIDMNLGKRKLYQSIYKLGRHLSWNPVKVRKAGWAAWKAYTDYKNLMSSGKLTPPQAIEKISGQKALSDVIEGTQEIEIGPAVSNPAQITIALIGHPYLLYDKYINHRIIHRLQLAGIKVITPEMLTNNEIDSAISQLVGKAYWTYEEDVVGAGGHYLQADVDGIIGLMAFGCGPDSLMMDTVRRQAAKQKTIPFMCLTMDEHTGEAGVITRLEAFTDMIALKKRIRTEVCV